MTSFVKKKRKKDVGIVALTWLAYFPPITLLPILQWHTGVCEETFDVNSKIAQRSKYLKFFCQKVESTRNSRLRRLSGRFQTLNWRPGEQSPGLSGRVVITGKAVLARYKLVTKADSHLSLRKSTTCMKSSTEYSLFISTSTLSDALWTGTCKKLYTRGWLRILAISYRE